MPAPDEWRLARRFDDAGRALMVGTGFLALGGVAPWLLNWIALLVLLPVIVWTAWEFEQAGMPLAGAVFLGVLPFSAFVIDTLLASDGTLEEDRPGFRPMETKRPGLADEPGSRLGLGGREAPRGSPVARRIRCRYADQAPRMLRKQSLQ